MPKASRDPHTLVSPERRKLTRLSSKGGAPSGPERNPWAGAAACIIRVTHMHRLYPTGSVFTCFSVNSPSSKAIKLPYSAMHRILFPTHKRCLAVPVPQKALCESAVSREPRGRLPGGSGRVCLEAC